MLIREQIITQARTWLGTKFRYQGRVKKTSTHRGGVDCLGLIICVCDELNYHYEGKLLSQYDNIVYSKKPDYKILQQKFSEFFTIKSINEISIGDIVLKQISNDQYHLMFYTGKSFIHASAITFSVVEHDIDGLDNCIVYSMFK